VYEGRVYVMVSEIAYLYANIHIEPSVVIVYQGGGLTDEKSRPAALQPHRFKVVVYQAIWDEERVMTDASEGLFKHQADLISLLHGNKTGFSTSPGVAGVWVTELLGAVDYPTKDEGKFKAAMAFNLLILEE
jgi:hypothetical protein